MPVNSRQKGKRGEREAVKFLQRIGFADAARTQQYRGTGSSSDVECPESLPNVHLEVKFGRGCSEIGKCDIGCKGLDAACHRAAQDAGSKPWCVLWRPTGVAQWRLTWDQRWRVTVANDNDIADVLKELNQRGE